MNQDRQNKILEIISHKQITTQEDLINELKVAGYTVTQATISRDLRKLNLVKPTGGAYTLPDIEKKDNLGQASANRYRDLLGHSITSVDYANNLVVIKTHTGLANAACVSIDSMRLPYILGSIAGDDTIFMIAKTNEDAVHFVSIIRDVVNIPRSLED